MNRIQNNRIKNVFYGKIDTGTFKFEIQEQKVETQIYPLHREILISEN